MGKKLKKLQPILQASYLNQGEASEKLKGLGYKYDPELSTNESKVFVDKKGRPNIAFRGSKRIVDDFLGSDLKLALGLEKYDKRFQEAQKLTKLVEEKYQKPANVFGHSLGGTLAEKSGAHGQIMTYNKGVGILDIGKKIPQNQTDFRNKNDIVSVLSLTQNHSDSKFKQKQNGSNPLDILGNHKYL
jgi:hypothetical protein